MKKGLLRTLSALLAVSMLLCMSMVAFADGQVYNVATTYDGTNVTVTTTVSGAVPSEQVAFLVEKGSNIVWIDQKPADTAGGATSAFTDTAANAVGATVKVGTSSLAASTFGDAKSIALPNYTVTWKVAGSTNAIVTAVVGDAEDTDGSATTSYAVTFYVAPGAGEELVSVTYGETTDTAFVGDSKTYTVSANTEFTFNFAAKELAADSVATVASVVPSGVTENTAGEKTASVAATATDATEFGLLVAVKDSADLTAVTSLDGLGVESAPIRKYAALGANGAGQFVIQLVDDQGVFFVDEVEYVACVYALGSSLTLGEVFDLN